MVTPRTQAAIAQLNHIHADSYELSETAYTRRRSEALPTAATHRRRTYHSKR